MQLEALLVGEGHAPDGVAKLCDFVLELPHLHLPLFLPLLAQVQVCSSTLDLRMQLLTLGSQRLPADVPFGSKPFCLLCHLGMQLLELFMLLVKSLTLLHQTLPMSGRLLPLA